MLETFIYLVGCNVMIASRKLDRLENAANELKTITPPGDDQPKPKIEFMECNIKKEEQVAILFLKSHSDFPFLTIQSLIMCSQSIL